VPTIIYITPGGERHEVDVDEGSSVMEGAINNDIGGIIAECGGACACATCHSYIDEEWLARLPEMDDMEDSMLDATSSERKQSSRLTCQLEVSAALDGLVVHIAENGN
jgi:ferredoxin, 2Fe-2S